MGRTAGALLLAAGLMAGLMAGGLEEEGELMGELVVEWRRPVGKVGCMRRWEVQCALQREGGDSFRQVWRRAALGRWRWGGGAAGWRQARGEGSVGQWTVEEARSRRGLGELQCEK